MERCGFAGTPAGPWESLMSGTSVIKSFDETPATMLHLTVRKSAV